MHIYGTYQAETGAHVSTAFDLMDADAASRLFTAPDSYLSRPSVDKAKDRAWNRRLLKSQITQGVLLGEPVPKMARRVQRVTGSNMAAATRTARTATTAAENAGRTDSYKRARSMGIDLRQEWLATLDGRTRHSHRQMDGERVEVGERFSNGCAYPGDPAAAYAETMNCRCTLVAAVGGIDRDGADRWSKLPEGMTYEQWRGAKQQDAVDLTRYVSDPTPYGTITRKQAGVIYRAHKEGTLDATKEQMSLMYGRYVDDFSRKPTTDAATREAASKLQTTINAIMAKDGEAANRAFQDFLDAHYLHFDDKRYPDVRKKAGLIEKAVAKAKRGISVEIDEMTPCLRRLEDGKILQTEFNEVKPKKGDYKDWGFDWTKPAKEGYTVKALKVEGDERVQGLLAFKDTPENQSVFVGLVESAPHNSAHDTKVAGKEYNGVGAHLFAEAVKESYERGYNGFVDFFAKTDLVDYYHEVLGAELIAGGQHMTIDEKAARRLYERYYGNKS